MKRVVIGLIAMLALLAPAAAQDYPNRPVKIIVAFPVGGLLDTVSRVVGEKLVRQARPAVPGRGAARRRRHARHPGGRARRARRLHADDDQRQSRREPERVQVDPVRQLQGLRVHRLRRQRADGAHASTPRCRRAPSRSSSRSPRRSPAACPTPRSGRAAPAIWRANCSPPRPASACCTCPTRAARPRSPTWSPATSMRCS